MSYTSSYQRPISLVVLLHFLSSLRKSSYHLFGSLYGFLICSGKGLSRNQSRLRIPTPRPHKQITNPMNIQHSSPHNSPPTLLTTQPSLSSSLSLLTTSSVNLLTGHTSSRATPYLFLLLSEYVLTTHSACNQSSPLNLAHDCRSCRVNLGSTPRTA